MENPLTTFVDPLPMPQRLIAAELRGRLTVRIRGCTIWVDRNEMVEIAVRFTRYSGRYMYHCHILEHEDRGPSPSHQSSIQ